MNDLTVFIWLEYHTVQMLMCALKMAIIFLLLLQWLHLTHQQPAFFNQEAVITFHYAKRRLSELSPENTVNPDHH